MPMKRKLRMAEVYIQAAQTLVVPTGMETSRKRFLAAIAFACAAHVGVLVYAAIVAPASPVETPSRIATLLMGHVGDQGDFEADGYVQARIRR